MLVMKLDGTKLIAAMFALSACGVPQYSGHALNSEAAALSKVAPNAAQKRSATRRLSGNFMGDLSQAVLMAPEYLAAQSAATEARYLVTASDANRKVQVVTSANAGSMVKNGAGLASTTTNGASANLSLGQLIYDGGASVASVDSAQANLFVAETEIEIVANKIAENDTPEKLFSIKDFDDPALPPVARGCFLGSAGPWICSTPFLRFFSCSRYIFFQFWTNLCNLCLQLRLH